MAVAFGTKESISCCLEVEVCVDPKSGNENCLSFLSFPGEDVVEVEVEVGLVVPVAEIGREVSIAEVGLEDGFAPKSGKVKACACLE